MNYEDDIRAPIPTIQTRLMGDYNETETIESFSARILNDNSIDPELKQIMIQSKIEENQKKSKKTLEINFRIKEIKYLVNKLVDPKWNKFNIGLKKYILNQIDLWVQGDINCIVLESEPIYIINELLDDYEEELDTIKNIFRPKDNEDYIEYKDMMDQIKICSIKEETERIEIAKKKLEKEKLLNEEKANKQNYINSRTNQTLPLVQILNKISIIDPQIKILKEKILPSITKYNELITNTIVIDIEFYEQTIKFINSVRISKDDKIAIENLLSN